MKESYLNGLQQLQDVYFYSQEGYQKQICNIAEEVPVALVYNGISHVVMMATPKDLALFAVGFSLSENIIQSSSDIYGIDIQSHDQGIEVHIELSSRRFMDLKAHRRALVGRTGCGICGTEQLAEIYQPLPILPFTQSVALNEVQQQFSKFADFQIIGTQTRGTHAAAWYIAKHNLLAGCEDIGRHVALDKVLGLRDRHKWQQGVLLISSRASYEMVKKAVNCGVEIICALSAPSSLAIQIAKQSRLTLIGFCRDNNATIFTHPERVEGFHF